MSIKLSELVATLGGKLQGQDLTIERVRPLAEAISSDISFLANPKYRHYLDETQAGAIIVQKNITNLPKDRSYILVDDPYLYFAKVSQLFHPTQKTNGQIHTSAIIDASAQIGEDCEIGANVVIGANAVIGARCRILSGTVIGENCIIGEECVLYPRVVLYHGVCLGDRVIIHSGCVIGADGFGIARDQQDKSWCKIPQIGGVEIGHDVEIGANTTIDRGALGNTQIGNGVKIDNQVQIGHNCIIGDHTAIAACSGISGSVEIGRCCIIGGAAMFVGHISVADNTLIGGGTAVTRSITEGGEHYATCFPLQTYKDWTRNAVHIRHLNEMYKRLKNIEKLLDK